MGRTQGALHGLSPDRTSAFPFIPITILCFKKERSAAVSRCASVQGFRDKGTIVF